jgi:ABC-type uncharacterized transport system ATPase subunit
MTPAVEVHDLEKRYGAVRAVDGITFSVAEGEVFGLLGHGSRSRTACSHGVSRGGSHSSYG